jgi:hypothetical protein
LGCAANQPPPCDSSFAFGSGYSPCGPKKPVNW